MLDRYIKAFIAEAQDLLADIEDGALALEARGSSPERINQLFRAFHTIKGSANICGLTAIVQFAHHVENVLDRVRDGTIPVTRKLIDLILRSEDQVSALVAAVQGTASPDPHETRVLIGDLSALAGKPLSNAARQGSGGNRKNGSLF